MPLTATQLTQICEHLAPLRPAAVYLFGSAAAENRRPGGDLDLAMLAAAPVAPERLLAIQDRLADALGTDVDLIDLSRATTVFCKEVLAGGRLIQETDPLRRAEFEMYAWSDYARLNEERAEVLAALGQPPALHD